MTSLLAYSVWLALVLGHASVDLPTENQNMSANAGRNDVHSISDGEPMPVCRTQVNTSIKDGCFGKVFS